MSDQSGDDSEQNCWSLGCQREPSVRVVGRANNPVSVCETCGKRMVYGGECEYSEPKTLQTEEQ